MTQQAVWAVGLMTGTVLDGNIDVALLKTDGDSIDEYGVYTLSPYDDGTIQLLQQALIDAKDWQFSKTVPDVFIEAERCLTIAQSAAVLSLIAQSGLTVSDISVVGFHGQSVLHRAPTADCSGASCQLGDGALMARLTGLNVVNDFRSNDINAGGHGAPLSAIYHQALLKNIHADEYTAVLNLGGVANISWTDHRGHLIAFDTGPANAPLNDFVAKQGLGKMDYNGQLAAIGHVDEQRLDRYLKHPFFSSGFPKSLDRNDFTAAMVDGLGAEDGAAFLTAFTASAVGKALDLLPIRPKRLIVCGGGRHNPTLMAELSLRAAVTCVSADSVGWRGDAVEAECFAYLAVRKLQGEPISFPDTTGVAKPTVGGVLHSPGQVDS